MKLYLQKVRFIKSRKSFEKQDLDLYIAVNRINDRKIYKTLDQASLNRTHTDWQEVRKMGWNMTMDEMGRTWS